MNRFLFVVPPLAGHVNPTVGVAAALQRLGHDTAWVGQPDVIRPLVGPGAVVFVCDGLRKGDEEVQRPPTMRGPAAVKFFWERMVIPQAERMVPGVRAAVETYRPDVIIVDQQTIAGALVGEAAGVPWATSATTSAGLTDPLAALPKVQALVLAQLDELRQRLGGDLVAAGDPRISPHLVLAFTTDALTGPGPAAELGHRLRFVGPSIARRPSAPDFPWEWLDRPQVDRSQPTVLVTLGTVNDDAGGRFLNECVDALAARPGLRAVVLDPAGTISSVPDNLLVRQQIPQLDLLPRVDAVVCHAGHNTVCESLYFGVPLVVTPIRDDQPIVAQQVADAGAGVRIRFGRSTAQHVGAAIDEVLSSESYPTNARRIGLSFRTAGGAHAAARHLEELAHVAA